MRCRKCFTESPSEEAMFCWKCGETMGGSRSGSVSVPLPLTPLKEEKARHVSPMRDRVSVMPTSTPPLAHATPSSTIDDKAVAAILERAQTVSRNYRTHDVPASSLLEANVLPKHPPTSRSQSPRRTATKRPSPTHIPAPIPHPLPLPLPLPLPVPMAVPAPKILSLAEHSSTTMKSSTLFDELDLRGSGKITLDDLRTALTRCGLILDPIDVADIFRKADIDKDTLLTPQEFKLLTDSYPALTDALFRRTKIYWEETAELRELEAAKIYLETLKAQELSERSADEIERQEDTLENERLRDAEAALAAEETKYRQTKTRLGVSADEISSLRSQSKELMLAHQLQSDRVSQRQGMLQDAKWESEQQQRAMTAQEGALQKSRYRLEELQAMLREQEEDVRRQEAKVERSRSDVESSRKREDAHVDMLNELHEEAAACLERARRVEEAVGKQEEEHRALECECKQAEGEMARVEGRREDTLQHIQWARERRSQQKKAVLHSKVPSVQAAIDEQQRLIQRLAQQQADKSALHKAEQDKETAVLNLELRLRRQRVQLEEDETVLAAAGREIITGGYTPKRY